MSNPTGNTIFFKTPMAEITFYKDKNYMHQLFLSKRFSDVEEAKQHLAEVQEKLGTYLPIPTISDISQMKGASKAVRDFSNKEIMPVTNGLAILVKSSISRMVGNMALRMINSKYPTRMFSNEEKAINWLLPEQKQK